MKNKIRSLLAISAFSLLSANVSAVFCGTGTPSMVDIPLDEVTYYLGRHEIFGVEGAIVSARHKMNETLVVPAPDILFHIPAPLNEYVWGANIATHPVISDIELFHKCPHYTPPE